MSYQDAEQKVIWDFLNSRKRVTYKDVATACPGSAWKRENYLLRLRKSGVLKFCGRVGREQYFTVFDVDKVNAETAKSPSFEQDQKWMADRLDARLKAMAKVAENTPEVSFEPADTDEAAFWTFARSVVRFSTEDVTRACGFTENKRNAILRNLMQSKLIWEWGRENRILYYTALTPKEQHARSKDLRRTKFGDIWTAIRIRRLFFPEDILASLVGNDIPITLRDVVDYCKMLQKAGYLQEVHQTRSATPNKRYRLVRNTGPLPPVKKRVAVVIDCNEDRIVHTAMGRLP